MQSASIEGGGIRYEGQTGEGSKGKQTGMKPLIDTAATGLKKIKHTYWENGYSSSTSLGILWKGSKKKKHRIELTRQE